MTTDGTPEKTGPPKPNVQQLLAEVVEYELAVLKDQMKAAVEADNHDAVCRYATAIALIKTRSTDAAIRTQAHVMRTFSSGGEVKLPAELAKKLRTGPGARGPEGDDSE